VETSRYGIEIPDNVLVVWMDTTFSIRHKVMCLVSRVIFRVVDEEDGASAYEMLRSAIKGHDDCSFDRWGKCLLPGGQAVESR